MIPIDEKAQEVADYYATLTEQERIDFTQMIDDELGNQGTDFFVEGKPGDREGSPGGK